VYAEVGRGVFKGNVDTATPGCGFASVNLLKQCRICKSEWRLCYLWDSNPQLQKKDLGVRVECYNLLYSDTFVPWVAMDIIYIILTSLQATGFRLLSTSRTCFLTKNSKFHVKTPSKKWLRPLKPALFQLRSCTKAQKNFWITTYWSYLRTSTLF
jgi:uncharacterized membrane protein YbaN (DUF454 family)